MTQEDGRRIRQQFLLPSENFEPVPAIVSASRRTELVGLRPDWLVRALQRFPERYNRDIHSVVLWTKDPTNIYAHKALREELTKHNTIVHCTITGLGGTRIEPTVPEADTIMQRLPRVIDALGGNPKRLMWRFDPIVTLPQEDGDQWSSSVYFEPLARQIATLGVDNCYFSFSQIYERKFAQRQLKEAGINLMFPSVDTQYKTVASMKAVADNLGITLYSCAQPSLERINGIIPARCIDAELLVMLHEENRPVTNNQDATQKKYRPACYCTESIDIGAYFPCGHGCVYCYAEAAVPLPQKLLQKPMP